MFRKILKIFNYKYTFWYAKRSSENMVTYLRRNGCIVGDNVKFRVPKNTSIDVTRPCLISIGNNVDINDHFTIMTHDFSTFVFRNLYHDFINSSGKVTIGNNIYFGLNVTVLKGVTIGDNCIIGAGALVTKSIPANSVAAGVPCKVICSLEDYYKKRKSLQLAEAIEYGRTLIDRKGHVSISDFTEEWSVFLTEEDYKNYPEIRKHVDFRLKNYTDKWLKGKRTVSGFDDFLKLLAN